MRLIGNQKGALEMKTKTLFLVIVMALTLSGCGGSSTFQQNRDKWESQKIEHYRFTVVVGCFCPFAGAEVTYEVLNGQVVNESVQPAFDRPDDPAQISDFYQPYNTIGKVFDYVEQSIKEADETTIQYEPTYGFPTSVSIDRIKQAADDEMYLTLSNFTPLP
jgi:Family of unknown function (DUF6174)